VDLSLTLELFEKFIIYLLKKFKEFVDAGADFFMGLNNELPSRYFFGPLS